MGNFYRKVGISMCLLFSFFVINNANEEVAAKFEEFQLVPDVIPTAPQTLLNVTYNNDIIVNLGNKLSPTEVLSQPKVEYEADITSFFTLIMTDPDVPSRVAPILGEFIHWLIVNIPGSAIDQGEVLAIYVSPTPPPGTGPHRYAFLLYQQPGELNFEGDRDLILRRINFKAAKFADKYNLKGPVAGNFFLSQLELPLIPSAVSLDLLN